MGCGASRSKDKPQGRSSLPPASENDRAGRPSSRHSQQHSSSTVDFEQLSNPQDASSPAAVAAPAPPPQTNAPATTTANANANTTAKPKTSLLGPANPGGTGSGALTTTSFPAGGTALEEHFTDEQLRQWNVNKLLQKLAAAAADDPGSPPPSPPAAGSGARAAAQLGRRAPGLGTAAGAAGGEDGAGSGGGVAAGGSGPQLGDMAVNARKQVSECAVSLEFLLEFAREIPDDWRTCQVVQDLIISFTSARQSRFTDLMPSRHVKRPDYFISHKWDSPFHYLVRSVRDYLSGAVPGEVYVWLDIFAVNQHPGKEQLDDLAQLNNAISIASGGTLVVLDHEAGPLGRVWCLFEIWISVRDKGLGSLHLLTYGFTNNDIWDLFQSIDIKAAKATNEDDRQRILKYIERSFKSLDDFNEMLKLLFLLDPLDFSSDVKEMLRGITYASATSSGSNVSQFMGTEAPALTSSRALRQEAERGDGSVAPFAVAARAAAEAATAAQVLAARDAWNVDKVVGEMRRVDPAGAQLPQRESRTGVGRAVSGPSLMIVYGVVGSGKSTFSASLARIAQERRERENRRLAGLPKGEEAVALLDLPEVQVDAVHFCKQSDRRRTDPLRMLKSLAYQLATNVPEMRPIYTSMPSESVCKISRLEEAFMELLQRPVQDYLEGSHLPPGANADAQKIKDVRGRSKQLVLLIDGVDEADGRAGSLDNNILRLLREHFPKLHPAVHIIVSCRHTSKRDDPLSGLRGRYDKGRTTVYDAATELRQGEHMRRLLKVKLHPTNCKLDPGQCSMHVPEMLDMAVAMVISKSRDSMVYIKVVMEHMSAVVKEHILRQVEEREVLQNIKAVSDFRALRSQQPTAQQQQQQHPAAASRMTTQGGNTFVSESSGSRLPTPMDAEAAAAELGATITALLSARLGEMAAGGSHALANLDQEVQKLIKGRLQSPAPTINGQASAGPIAPITVPDGGDAGRRGIAVRGRAAARGRHGPSVVIPAPTAGSGWARGGVTEQLGAPMLSEEDDFRWNWQDIKNLPNGLGAAYRQIFMTSFQKLAPQSHAQVMKLLQVLLAAREPLTRNQLQNLHLVSSPHDLQKLPGWGVLFYEREYMVFHMHKSLFDFLSNKKEAGPFFVDAQRGHKLIAAQLFKEIMVAPTAAAVASSAASVINGGGSDPLAASAVSQYTLRYAVTHLALADMLEELSQLLLNFDFWETIFEKGLGLEVLGDLIHIRGWELPKDTIAAADVVAASSTVVSHVIRWLQRDGAMLKQYPKAVLQLATDTPVNSLVSKAALSYHRRPHAHLVNKDAGWPSNLMTLENSVHRTNSLAFLPKEVNGSSLRLVTGADDGVVRVWDMRSGDLLFAMQPPIQAYQGTPPAVKCIAVTSAMGATVVASAGNESAVRLWSIKTGQQFADLGKSNSALTGTVRALAMSPDGRIILSAGDDLALRAWTPAAGSTEDIVVSETGEPELAPAAMVDDAEADPIKIWGCPAVTSLQDKPHKKVIRCIAFSADGHLFATGSDDDDSANAVALCLWETEGFKVRGILRGHISGVKCVAFTTRPVSVVEGHPAAAPQHLLASGSADRTVRLWYTKLPAARGSSREGSDRGSSDPGAAGGEDWAVPNPKLQGHTATVRAVAFSPDGAKMASAGEDCSVRLWGVVSRQQLAVFHGHSAAVVSLSFDWPDGMVLASCSDSEVRLWDTNNYPQVTVMHGHESGVNTIAFTSDGKYLASGSDDGALVVWKDNGENHWTKVKTIPPDASGAQGHRGSIIALAFSPADDDAMPGEFTTRLLATASADKTIRLWALRETWKLDIDVARAISTVAGILRGKGKALIRNASAAAKKDQECVTVEQLSVVQGHDGSVRAISFSADGTQLATGSNDRTVRLWHLDQAPGGYSATITPFLVLSGHTDVIRCVAFSPVASSRLMASASEDRTVRLWHVPPAGQGPSGLHRELRGHDSWVICCAFSSHGQRVATASLDKTVRIWSVATGEQQLVLHGHSSGVTSVAFSPDSMTLVSGGADNSVRQWNARTGQQLAMMQGHIGQIAAVAYSPTGHTVGSGAADATVRLWDATRGQQVAGVQGDAGSFQTVAISPDDKFVSSSSDDNVIRLWDMASGEQRAVLQGHTSWIVGICFGFQEEIDGDRHLLLASCSDDCSIRVWDCVTSECIRELRGHTGSVRAVAWESLKWRHIASAGNDYTVRLWNVQRGSQVDLYKGHTDVIRSLAFSPDGLMLASSAEDTTIRLYHVGHITGSDAQRPEWLPELPGSGVVLAGHKSWVLAVAFGQRKAGTEDRLLVSGSWDQTVRLWNLPAAGKESPTCLATLSGHSGRINGVAISTFVITGLEMIASASNDSTMILWTRTNRPDLAAEANGWEAVCKIRGHAGHVNAVAFNSKGSRLASASEDETVRVWELSPTSSPDQISAGQVRDFKGIQGSITVLAMSPDGQLLASGSDDHTLRLWSTRSNQQLMVLQGHGSAVSALAFDDEGGVLASGSLCGTVLLWAKDAAGAGSREGWSQVAKLDLAMQVPDAAVSALALTHYLLSSSSSPSNPLRGPLQRTADSSDLDLAAAAAPPSGGGAASYGGASSASSLGTSRLLLACGTKPREMQSRREGVAVGRHAGMGRPSGAVRTGGGAGASGRGTAGGGTGDDDFFGGRLISSSLTLWDVDAIKSQPPTGLRSSKPFKALKCQSAISCTVFNNSGELLASASYDNVVYLWRPSQQNPVARMCHPSAPDLATSLCFTQDDTMLVAACRYSDRVDVYEVEKACSCKEGSVTPPLPLGRVDGSGLEGTCAAPCDHTGDGTADRQLIVCRSGFKNQAMHLQVLELPPGEEQQTGADMAAAGAGSGGGIREGDCLQAAAGSLAATSLATSAAATVAPSSVSLCTRECREVANVYTCMPIQQIACFEDLLVVTNGRSIDFYRLGGGMMG